MPEAPLYILAIENSNPSAADDAAPHGPGVAVLRAHEGAGAGPPTLLAIEPIRVVARERDDLMPAVDRAMTSAGLRPRQIGLVAVSVGPGGYTAVRSACSAGKMIAQAAGARCAAVSSAHVAALAAIDAGLGDPFAVLLASKDDSSHATRFDRAVTWNDVPARAMNRGLIGAADVEPLQVAAIIADRFLPAPIRDEATRLRVRIIEPAFDAHRCGVLAVATPWCDPVALNPFYPREPDAVRLWKQRQA
ncbi:MAG: hypothetical protein AB7G11_13280 [Phycisphaerales bacterium]